MALKENDIVDIIANMLQKVSKEDGLNLDKEQTVEMATRILKNAIEGV